MTEHTAVTDRAELIARADQRIKALREERRGFDAKLIEDLIAALRQPAQPEAGKHPSHEARFSDASSFDEICEKCGATDIAGGGWGKLAEPCPAKPTPDALRAFALGDRVTKIKGSSWTGRVVGFYSTALTPEGYAVESENEPGTVQIYPRAALGAADA